MKKPIYETPSHRGLGFIGSNFIGYMLTKYDTVQTTNLDKLSIGSNPANLKDYEANRRYKFVKEDIANKKLVQNLVIARYKRM